MKQFEAEQTDELLARYRASHHLSKTRKFLTLPIRKQKSILRDHNSLKIDRKEEIQYRVSVDIVLDVVGVLEVVALATGHTPSLHTYPLSSGQLCLI